jgi:hypothetical protein
MISHGKKWIILFLVALFSLDSDANIAEYFGSSTSTGIIGNQANFDENDAANNYYAASILAFAKRFNINFSAYAIATDFKPITGVVTKNSTNSSTTETGDVDTEYGDYQVVAINLLIPVLPLGGSLAMSVFSPTSEFMTADSGHPFLPEYVMYRSRYKRTSFYLNYAQSIGSVFSFSLGTYIGFQASARANAQTSLNGTDYDSNASTKAKVTPSIAGLFSSTLKFKEFHIYAAFQQELKSQFHAITEGEISEPTSFLFNIDIDGVMSYDPTVYRLGLSSSVISLFRIYLSGEYQDWEGYESPVIKITQNSGSVLGSSNFERIQTQNIVIPKVGISLLLGDSFSLSVGGVYRPTPIKGDFSGSGNSIDTNATILTGGLNISLFKKSLSLALGAQYHMLEERTVTKSTGQENGNSGQKIGAPGYTIGGSLFVTTLGLQASF